MLLSCLSSSSGWDKNPSWQRFFLPVLVTCNTSQPGFCLLTQCLFSKRGRFGNSCATWECAKSGLRSATSLLQNLKDFLGSIAWVIRVRESYMSSVCLTFSFWSNVIHCKVESYGSTDSRRRTSPHPCFNTLLISSALPDLAMKDQKCISVSFCLNSHVVQLSFCKSAP